MVRKKPIKSAKDSLAEQVESLQKALVRKLNDTHIFAGQAISLLKDARDNLLDSPEGGKRKYYVPSSIEGKKVYASRTDEERQEIFDRFIKRELYENFIVTAVSQFESFLFEVLDLIIATYPKKLTLNIKGEKVEERTIPLETLLNAESKADAIGMVIRKRLQDISYAPPKVYLEYIKGLTGIDTKQTIFLEYFEIKATRDVIVHNSGVVNSLYLEKARNQKRGALGDKLEVDEVYFDECIAKLKRLSQFIIDGVTQQFPN